MKPLFFRIFFSSVILGALLTYSSCSDPEVICLPGFDLDQFELNVIEKRDGKVKKYGYSAVNMNLTQRMHAATVIITNSVHDDGLGLVTLSRETYDEAFGCF